MSISRDVIRRLITKYRGEGVVPLNELEDLVRINPQKLKSDGGMYVVRLYDGGDHLWMDVSKPCSWDEAVRLWNEKTDCGMQRTNINDFDYYKIFPAETRMLYR